MLLGRRYRAMPVVSRVGDMKDPDEIAQTFADEPDREILRERVSNILVTNRRLMKLAEGSVRDSFMDLLMADEIVYKIHPCTIFATKYGGSLEGGLWCAVHAHTVPQDAVGEPLEVKSWFDEPTYTYGVGATPNQAMLELHNKL
jgi:hypothetical protein